MNLNKALKKEYETMSLKELMDAPVSAIQGVSDSDAQKLQEAFNIKTVKELGQCKYFVWACAMTMLAESED